MSRVTLDLAWHKWRRLYAALFSCGRRPCYVTVVIMSCHPPHPLHPPATTHQPTGNSQEPTTAFAVLYFCILLPSSHCVGQQMEQWGIGSNGDSNSNGNSNGNGNGDGEECMLSALLSCLCNCAVVKGHTRGHMSSLTVCCCAAFLSAPKCFPLHVLFIFSLQIVAMAFSSILSTMC